jgi:hypothetical protein
VKELQPVMKYLRIHLIFLDLIAQMQGKVTAAVTFCSFSGSLLQAGVPQH